MIELPYCVLLWAMLGQSVEMVVNIVAMTN